MKCYVEVYGCTANKSDASIVKGLIQNHPSFELVDNCELADIFIILTCTVIDTTEQRMLHRIQVLAQTNKKLVIAGCMASVQQEAIRKLYPQAILIEPRNIHNLLDVLDHVDQEKTLDMKSQISKSYDDLIAPVMIAEGCLFSCHYCITHLARGSLHSYPEQAIIDRINEAISQGCREIQLTAQDTASYGIDTQSSLPNLLKRIIRLEGKFMIRIGMMNPRTAKRIHKELTVLFQNDHIYSFLHLPIQSGDNIILERMNRGYFIEEAYEIINDLRSMDSDLTLSTDVIVGYPGESTDQFEKTKQMLKKIQPDIVNITRFSARPKTKAKRMPNRIPTELVKKRSKDLTIICKNLMQKRNKRYIGRRMSVVSLKKGTDKSVLCRSKNYKPVVIKKPLSIGETYSVEIIDATDTHLVGMLK